MALAQQRAGGGIAVHARQAGPHHLAAAVEQRRDVGVADDRQLERLAHGVRPAPKRASHSCSQARTANESTMRQRAAEDPGPTFTDCPPRRLTTPQPYSSVWSSPTKTGVRPADRGSPQDAPDPP